MGKHYSIDEQRLVELYVHRRMPCHQVAAELRASPAGVRTALIRLGVALRDCQEAALSRVKSLPLDEIAGKYLLGEPAYKLAEEYNCTTSVLLNRLRAKGLPIRRRGETLKGKPSHKRVNLDIGRAIELNKSGKSYSEISMILGVTYGVLCRRMKEAGYHPNKIYRAKYERYMSLDHHKRKVAAAIDASSCWICGEDRAVDLAHIAPKAEDYPLVPENALALCPTHHRLYDYGLLRKEEVEKIMPKLKEGAQCGFNSQHYRVTTLSLVSAG